MRMMLGIAISVPIAAIFCFAYLTALALETRPDLILLDLHLPDMSGEEVLRRLRAEQSTHAIPVVIVSADASSGQSRRLMSLGADGYLTKPLDLVDLLSWIDNPQRHDEPSSEPGGVDAG